MRTTFATSLVLAGLAAAAPAKHDRRQAPSVSAPSVSAPSVSAPSVSAPSVPVSAPSAPSVSAPAPSASAAPNATADLLNSIRARNANAFAGVLEANPTIVQSLLSLAGGSPYTILLPSDAGVAAIPSSVTGNTTQLTNLITYHVLTGNITAESTPVNVTTVAQSALANYQGVSGPQPLPITKDQFGTTRILGLSNAYVLANSTYENFTYRLLNGSLTLPVNVSSTAAQISSISTVAGLLAGIPQLVSAVDTLPAVTAFIPNNAAVASLAGTIGQLPTQTVTQVLQNHVIPGSTVFSSQIQNGQQAQNANQQPISFVTNSTGAFVTSGGVTAQIVQTDFNAINGVVHVIDRLLFQASSATAAASSAASASSGSASASAASSASSSASAPASSATA